jgi:hypothetical protein
VGIDIFESIASFLSKKIKKCLARSLSDVRDDRKVFVSLGCSGSGSMKYEIKK